MGNRDGAAPVVVVGNGPVGQSTALLLARWGVPVVLLDQRARRDRIGSKAICQQRDVLDVWDSVGAGEQIAAEGLTWTTVRTFYRQHELFSYRLPDAGYPHFPPFVNISQSRTEEILDAHIAAQPLIEVRWGHAVEGLEQDGDGVTLSCRVATREQAIRAPYVVCCTGSGRDHLRQRLGVSLGGESFDDRFLICDVRTELPGWDSERRFYFDPAWNPGRQVLIHPCPDSTFRIDWQVPGSYSLEADEASGGLDERIRAIIGERPYEIVWKSVYRFQSRLVDRMRVGRVLLAGDAAHLVAPFGARGLNSGVADAENAAWKIAFVLRGWADPALLDSYHDERHAAAVENLEVTTATMDFLVPHDEQQARRRQEILERAVANPRARGEVDSGRLCEPFWYATSPLTTPDPGRARPGRPPRGEIAPAAPGTIVPDAPIVLDGAPTRLRAVARHGILLLTGTGVGVDELRAAEAGGAPLRVLSLPDIDPSGAARRALGARPGEVWVIRPDAHIAAVLGAPALGPAIRRLLGRDGVAAPRLR